MAEAAAAESTPLRPMLITFIELKSRLAVLSESLSSFVFIVVSMMKFSSGKKTGNRLLFYFFQCYFEILSTYGLLTPILKQFSNVTFIKIDLCFQMVLTQLPVGLLI